MKSFLCVIVMVAAASAQASGTKPKYNQFSCTGTRGNHVVVFGLGTDTLSVSAGFDPFEMQAMSTGDCEGRKTFCYEEDQWMINIPNALARGARKTGHIWLNENTDDRPENNRLGDRYDCVADFIR